VETLTSEEGFFSPSRSAPQPIRAENDDASGNRLTIGRYEIIRSIGKGAMGEVFLGRDPHINRLTAIKTVHFEDTFAEEDIEQIKAKFFREAESAGTLSHPHIVTIYDAGEDSNIAYIAMELLEGSTLLRFALRQHLLPLRRLIRYMEQVAEALEYAHSQGVIHRDIKPANIILTQSGQIKITDFGIAHIATSSQTQTGVVKGTPYYMSPEQFSGKKVDGRSDIFSLGTTLFQLLTGTLPFYAESPALLMNQIMNFPHPNPRAINPRVVPAMVAIVDKALAKERDNRYQSAKALANDLRRLDSRIKAALRKGQRHSR
jgi:serine/threonine-protein kinase